MKINITHEPSEYKAPYKYSNGVRTGVQFELADAEEHTLDNCDCAEYQAERAENYRDSLREDGINI